MEHLRSDDVLRAPQQEAREVGFVLIVKVLPWLVG